MPRNRQAAFWNLLEAVFEAVDGFGDAVCHGPSCTATSNACTGSGAFYSQSFQIEPGMPDDVSVTWQGELLHIHIAAKASAVMKELNEATLTAGVGIEGDRYAAGLGAYSKNPHIDRQVTLIEVEVLEAIGRDRGIALAPNEHRRNLTTRGVPLGHLVGQYFRVGDCVLYGGRMNVPCLYLETLLGKRVFKPLINRSGLNCRIVLGGTIRSHERIDWCDPASLDVSIRLANEATPLEPPPEV